MIFLTLALHSHYLLPAVRIVDLEDTIINRIVEEMEIQGFLSTNFNTKAVLYTIAELGKPSRRPHRYSK